jgi:site-specific DNA-cytosine methylase
MRRRSRPARKAPTPASAVDLFCGAGGLTRGLLNAGIPVSAGYDVDEACRFPYEHNNRGAAFRKVSVADLDAVALAAHYPAGHTRILVGCAPCQTFSKYTQGLNNGDDPTWTLLDEFARLVCEVKPDIVSIPSVDGRMEWDKPTPTITTKLFGFANEARFGFLRAERSAQSAGNGNDARCHIATARAAPCVV